MDRVQIKVKYLAIATWIALLAVVSSARADSESFVIIVHASNATKGITRKFLSDVFLKKITNWEDGESIFPVDLDAESEVRKEFSNEVLKRPVAAVRSYWQQMIFSGQAVQPLELDSEAQVIRYVGSHPNAVAYISGSTALSSKVKSVSWR